MTLEVFEGPAGSGKTFNLAERVRTLVKGGMLTEGQRVLALTYMNGSRRRLEESLGAFPELRRRFECRTFDSFAQGLSSRRRSLLAENDEEVQRAALLGTFDRPCHLAGHLLQSTTVSGWVAVSYPLVIVDEAQDLDRYRLPIIQRLEQSALVLAAADEFQCLNGGHDAAAVMSWLATSVNSQPLSGSRRTTVSGILDVALALREGRSVTSVLTKAAKTKAPTWRGEGFRLVESPNKKGLLPWMIANELNQLPGGAAILTPNTTDPALLEALETVGTKTYEYPSSGQTFGPFTVQWELKDDERRDRLCRQLDLIDRYDLVAALASLGRHEISEPAIATVCARLRRKHRVSGQVEFTKAHIVDLVDTAVRDLSRFGSQRRSRYPAMSIHAAKNREFENVLVLWPYSGGSPEHHRRLLYNAVTRSKRRCTILVIGQGRTACMPFATPTT